MGVIKCGGFQMDKVQVVSFSGGRTSAFLVYLLKQKAKSEGIDVKYVFMDTGGEHPATYKFVKDVIKYFDIDLVCLQAEVDPELGKGIRHKVVNPEDLKFDLSIFEKLVKKHGNFTTGRPYCTARLKTQVFESYCNDTFGRGNYDTWIGIRADEPNRLPKPVDEESSAHHKKKASLRYLAEISDWGKEDIIDWWGAQSFDLDIAGDQHLGNCIFCVKKSAIKIALAERDEPERYKLWNRMVSGPDNVRLMPADKFGIGHIYRQWATPSQIIASFSDVPTDTLRQRVYKTKQNDSFCSESCEAFGQEEIPND